MLDPLWTITGGSQGCYRNGNGDTVIDLGGGFGYQVKEVIEPVIEQAERMGLSSRVLLSEPLIKLCHRVAQLLPAPLASSYVCGSGDEAFEGALKLCKGLKPHANTIVYLEGVDYGRLTYGRCMSHPMAYREVSAFLGVRLVPVRRVEQLATINWKDCLAVCIGYIHYGEDGRHQRPPPALLDALHLQARQVGTPLIGYDVNTCLGGLGTLFGFQHAGQAPDVLVLGGPLSGSAIPIGLYTCSEALAYRVYGRSTPAKHGSTTAGNPMACVAALAALEHALLIDTASNCSRNGERLAAALRHLGARAIGGWVSLPLVRHPINLQSALLARGVYVDSPSQRELLLRCPLSAQGSVIAEAALIIEEILTHAFTHAA